MIPARFLLWVDSLGGLFAGAVMFAFLDWLSELYRLPREVVAFVATANIAYGCFSLSLALRVKRSRAIITTLSFANALWAILCFVGAVAFWRDASMFGIAQFVLEGVYVGYLARIEWLLRDQLVSPCVATIASARSTG